MSAPPALSGAVMAHPRRAAEARALAELAPEGLLEVVLDPDPTGPPTALRTAALAWSRVPSWATHHLVLQDDVRLADGFFAHAVATAAHLPDSAVAFYTNWNSRNGGAVRLAALTGAGWAEAVPEYAPCVALMLPAAVAAGYRAYAGSHGAGWPYDVLMHRYLRSTGTPLRIAVPNTVEHSAIPSLAGNAAHGLRRSALYRATAAAADGTVDTARPVIPFLKHGTAQCLVRDGAHWEVVDAERHLLRTGEDPLACRRLFERTAPVLPGADGRDRTAAWQVWLTAYLTGRLAPAPDGTADPALEAAALVTIGPGGLCDDRTPAELEALTEPLLAVATAALAAGRAAERPAELRAERQAPIVLLGPDGLTAQLASLLGDLGHRAIRPAPGAAYPEDARAVVQFDPEHRRAGRLPALLAAAERAGIDRVLHVTTPGGPVPEPHPLLQVLYHDQLVGPYAPTGSTVAHWIELAWTRRPLPVSADRAHRLLDTRDLASAVSALLAPAGGPSPEVTTAASATVTEAELADLVGAAARATTRQPADRTAASAPPQAPSGAVELTDLDWKPTADLADGLRAFAQWLAYDTECPR